MFVQVIQGKVSDPAAVRAAFERWVDELGGGAEGWLGSTTGVTADGTFVALARFESEEAARRNSDRPEQGGWWQETSKLFAGEPTFQDSTRVAVDTYGDPDQAGFVQVMQGRTTDPDRGWELMQDDGGVDWGGEPVTFVVGIAGRGDEHLEILSQIAILFSDEDDVERLKQAGTPEELYAILSAVNES